MNLESLLLLREIQAPSFLLLVCFLAGSTTGLADTPKSDLPKDIEKCAQENEASERLACYDTVAEKYQLVKKLEFITPPDAFLKSLLVVTPWKPEYKLTVDGFVNLIETAVMENGKKIQIHGWTKQGHDYILNITMRHPLRLHFLPFETATDDIPLSLLRNPVVDGNTRDSSLFITTIASMAPDTPAPRQKEQ